MFDWLRRVRVSAWTRLGFVTYWLAAGVACLAALELLLRVLGAGEGPPAYDPMVGFSAAVPLFEPAERADGIPIFRVSPARLLNETGAEPMREREFRAEKPSNGFRVFVVGESSAAGHPYPPAYAFGAWLERRLQADLPDLSVEVVNAAVAGYSSRRALVALREITSFQPDVVIVYSGHNEWAERRYYSRLIEMNPWLFRLRERLCSTRLFTVASHWLSPHRESPREALERFVAGQRQEFTEMFAVFSRRVEGGSYATPEQIAQRDGLYRLNLEEIARTAQEAGAHVVFLTLSQNFADWSPGASTHRPGLTDPEAAGWQALFAEGERAAAGGDCRAALAAWDRALAIDDEYALLHYRIAGCQRALQQWDLARAQYRRASDLDRVPHGAPTHFNDWIRSIAARSGALVVDTDALLASASEHGLVGDDLIVEFVHPNLRAHQLIAAEIERVLRGAGIPRPASDWRTPMWVDPSPEQLVAENPSLRVREHESIRLVCLVARRMDCVREQEERLRALGARIDR
jgi:lysophospholipase L1-like esterase